MSFRRRSYLIRTALSVSQGKIRLLLHTVQIFMEPIQQKGQQLLGVLLLVARELRSETPHLCLKTKARPFGYFRPLGCATGASHPGVTDMETAKPIKALLNATMD